jgi:RNase P/RNase MRP subunit p29
VTSTDHPPEPEHLIGKKFRVVRARSRPHHGIRGRILGFTRNCLVYGDRSDQKLLPLEGVVLEVELERGRTRIAGDWLLRLLQDP